jgi:hypothetical protein
VAAEARARGIPMLVLWEIEVIRDLIWNGENSMASESVSDYAAGLAVGHITLMNYKELRIRPGSTGPASVQKYSSDSVPPGLE